MGADTLLTYWVEPLAPEVMQSAATSGGEILGSVEVRLINVESGLTLFRQVATSRVRLPHSGKDPGSSEEVVRVGHREAVQNAGAYALGALVAAFGDNPLGVVPNIAVPGEGVLVQGVLQGSPAHMADLQGGDRIIAVNGRLLSNWTIPLSVPATLTLERAGKRREVTVRSNYD